MEVNEFEILLIDAFYLLFVHNPIFKVVIKNPLAVKGLRVLSQASAQWLERGALSMSLPAVRFRIPLGAEFSDIVKGFCQVNKNPKIR